MTNASATSEIGEPAGGFAATNSVWYHWSTTTNGVVTFSPLSRRSKERQLYERVPLREKDIREAMHNAGGIQTHAARMLGVSLRQLRYALSRFGIKATEFKY